MGFFFQASLERGWKMGREFCIVTGFILTVLGGCVGSCQVQNSESKLKDLYYIYYYYRRLFSHPAMILASLREIKRNIKNTCRAK